MIFKITEYDTHYIDDLIANIRESDYKEYEQMGMELSFHKAVYESVKTSIECYCLTDRIGKVIAIFGASKEVPTGGRIVWALGTDLVDHNKKTFMKATKHTLNEWVDKYGLLWNSVAVWNDKSIRWLKWLKAEFGKPILQNGHEFLPFLVCKKKGE